MCFGKCPLEGYPSHPPPHRVKNPLNSHVVERGRSMRTQNPVAELGRGERGGEEIAKNYATR
jgi:hypothetical protein